LHKNFKRRDEIQIVVAGCAYSHLLMYRVTGFDGVELTPYEFKEALRRTFNLNFTPSELGALVRKYDKGKQCFL
jgi:hypothetical protein